MGRLCWRELTREVLDVVEAEGDDGTSWLFVRTLATEPAAWVQSSTLDTEACFAVLQARAEGVRERTFHVRPICSDRSVSVSSARRRRWASMIE